MVYFILFFEEKKSLTNGYDDKPMYSFVHKENNTHTIDTHHTLYHTFTQIFFSSLLFTYTEILCFDNNEKK